GRRIEPGRARPRASPGRSGAADGARDAARPGRADGAIDRGVRPHPAARGATRPDPRGVRRRCPGGGGRVTRRTGRGGLGRGQARTGGVTGLTTIVAEPWPDWGLIDCGNGQKLERYGPVVVARPEPQAMWAPADSA